MSTNTEDIAGKFLGKKVEGKSIYDPSFLVAVPRQENRTYLGIDETNCPEGFDTWYGYEFTAITNSGVPLNRVIKIVYPSSSPSIVESKSLKLYLNTFAMTKLGDTFEEVLAKAQEMIKSDLSKLLETDVQVSFLNEDSCQRRIFGEFKDLYTTLQEADCNPALLNVTEYNENKGLLKISGGQNTYMEHYHVFHSLKSNCRVTHQPDFGDIFIYYKSQNIIDEESLVKYLCSFRNEFHFHEEIVECCFTRLSEILDHEDELMVTALYTRRGGISIQPCRYQNIDYVDATGMGWLKDANTFTKYALNIKE